MKTNGKSSKPIIAAQSKKNNSHKPAPPDSNGNKARVSRAGVQSARSAADEMKLLVLDRISEGLMGFDANMNSTYINQRAGEILGCEPDSLLGKNFREAYPDSSGTPFGDAVQRALETQSVIPFESYFPGSGGWFGGRVYPADDGVSILFADRGEKHTVDISRLPEQNPYPVMCLARDGSVLYANRAAAGLLDSWRNEGQGIPIEMEQLLPVVLDSNAHQEVEFRNEGRIFIGLLVPIQETGQVNIYCRDVTERRQSYESLRVLINQGTTGITRTDPEGRFTFVNQAFCEMLGYSESELLGKTIWEVSHPDDVPKNRRFHERLKDGEPYQLEKRLIRRNGSILWTTIGTSPLQDAAGKMWAASSIVVDITRRKRAEESLLDSARRSLYLGTLSDTIRSLSDPFHIQTETIHTLGAYLKASRLAYLEIEGDGNLVSRAQYADGVRDMVGLVNIHQVLTDDMLAKLNAGRSVIVTDVRTAPGYGDEYQAAFEANAIRSQVLVPVLRNGELVAALCVQQSSRREWKTEEIHLMEETLERMQATIERVEAEQQVIESEKRFRILANTVPSIVWSTAPDGRILYFNDQWYAYTGLTPEETVANWAERTIHPDDYERSMSAWNQALETVPEKYLSELRYRRYDGEYRWFQSHAIPACDESGNVTAWYGVTTDIHDRMQAETALRESEERLRLATQAAHLCTWELDVSSETYKLGDNFEEVVGFSRDLLPEKPNEVSDRINVQEDLQAVRDILIEAVKAHRNEVSSLQYRLVHPETEEIIWVEVNAKLVYDKDSRPQRLFGMLQNITWRKQKEEEQRAQDEELQTIINRTPFMLTHCSRDLRYRFVSRAYAEMIGRSPADVAGRPILEIMGEDGWKTIAPYVEQVLKGKRVEYETEVSFEGVGAPALHVIYTPDYDEHGEVIGWFASMTDITKRKTAEKERDQLLEREQAQRLAAEQSRLQAEQAQATAEQELTERKLAEEALGTWTDAPLPQEIRSPWLRYGMALVATAIAVFARTLLDPVVGDFVQFTTLFGAVAFSVWYGGTGPALVSALLGYVGISWLILDWQHFIGPTAGSWIGLAIVLFSSAIIIALGGAMRRAQRHAHRSARVAVERQRQAEFRLAEQKRTEEALRESERKFSLIYDNLPFAATLATAQDSILVDVNDEFEKAFGYSKQEAIGKTGVELGINPDAERRQKILEDLQRQDSARDLELELFNRSGEKNLFLTNIDLVTINGEKYFLTTMQDITERKQIEQALARERELFKLLFETMPVMVSMYDPETQSMRLNAEFQRAVGWKAEDASVSSLLHALYPDPEYLSQVLQRMAEAAGKNEWVEAQIQTQDGRTLDSLWSNISIMNDKEIVTGIAIGIDITERKQAERALAEYARQQEALYNLADRLHQTNTPQEIFDASLDAICDGVRSDRASILLFDDQDMMRFVSWRGLSDEYRKATDGHSPWTRQEKNPVPICFSDIDTADLNESLKAVIKSEGIGSLAFIPLISNGNLIGKFMVYFNTPHEFSEGELDLSLTIARQLASAVDRKRADDELRASEELYRAIARNIPGGGVYVVDKDFRYIVADGPVTEAFGLSSKMLEGRTVSEVFPDERGQRMEERIRQNFAGEIVNFETKHNERVYWTQQAPLHDSIGQAIIVTMDITERKQAEERLRASEEKYRRIVETANEGIWEIDRETRTLFVNQRMAEMLGYTVEEMTGRPVFDFLLPEDYAEGERRLDSAKQGESVRTREFRYRRKDNSILWTVASNTAERDEQGNFLGAFAMMSDITERKQAEQALRQSEERFARFMQYLPGLAWIKDVQGRYIYANAAAELAFNTPRDQLYGRTDHEIFRPEEAEQFRRNDEQVVREEKGTQVVEQLQQEDGVLHYSLVTKFPIPGADGTIAMIGGTAFDITERVQMEEAIKQARQKAEETADRMARLQQITAALTQTLTPTQLAELALEQGTRAAGAATGVLAEKLDYSSDIKIVAALGYPDGAVSTNPLPLSDPSPLADCIRTGKATWLRSQQEFALQYPQQAAARSKLGLEAIVVLPLIVGNQTLGSLAFSFAEPHDFLAEERGFFLSLVHQCAQALERTHAAEALRESEERYRAIVHQATAGIVRKDSQGGLLFVNDAFCEMLGYDRNELIGKTMWELTHEEDVRENKRLYNLLMRDGIPFQLEKRLIRKDGSILWATVSVSPVLDASGKPQSAVSVYADSTDRKQAEQDLQESRERYRDLFNLVPIAVYTTDANGLIQEYNRSAIDLWGREPLRNDPSERYCGSFKIYSSDGRYMPHRKCPMARMLGGETLQPQDLEIIIERRDGSRRNVIAHPLAIRNEHGEIIGAINCLYDMTPRKQAEERFALLAEVSELTRKIEEPDELMTAVANVVGRHLEVRRCLFNEIDLEHDLEIVHRDYHDGVPSVEGRHKISEYSSTTTAEIATGMTIVNHDAMVDPRTAADYERSYVPNKERSYVAVPLMRDDRWVASLWVSDDLPREWHPEEVALIESVAERTWTATEKLRINSALRDSEERLRVTFNTTAVGFATLAPDTSFIDVNAAFCDIVGYSRQELLNMNGDLLTHPDYLDGTRQHVAQLLAGEISSFVLEKLYIRKNGAEIWVQESVSLVRDADGVPLHLIAIIQDVTERKRTEDALHRLNVELESRVAVRTAELQAANEELRESEETSRIILESMPDAIVITDKDGRIVHCNAQVETLFGYKPDELFGQYVEILMPRRFHESHVTYRHIFNDDRYPRVMGLGRELFGLRRDQSEFPIEMMLSPVSNKTNWDVMITIRDNTEQRKAQEAIRANEEKLRTLFELLPVGISFLDDEGRITEMNPALAQILGVSRTQLLTGKYTDRQYIQSDGTPMPSEQLASFRAHADQRPIYDVETGIVKENGETIWTSVNAAPVDVAGVDVVVATIDITARKKVEEVLRRNRERLRILSRRLVEVQEDERRNIARELHDRVGQNLAALNLNLNILRSQLSQDTIERVGGRISDSVSLVNQILTITRSVMSDLRSNVLDDYGLESAIREYADQFAQRTGVRVVIERASNPLPRLQSGIEMTLLRIAQEALTNVARHAQASQATITLRADEQAVYMSVQDDGIGILSWQKANQPGSHGLRIIRERAEAFDGSLQVNSAYKKGTAIEVKIPLGRNNE